MKKSICYLLLFLPLLCSSQLTREKKFSIGSNFVHRYLEEPLKSYSYPRISAEYSLSNYSSVELLAEYINFKKYDKLGVITYPISLGYKLNILPWVTKNQWLTKNAKVYQSARYSMVLTNNNFTSHALRYAPGIDVFLYKNLGLNGEIVFGRSMKTTFALGVKFRL